MRRTVGYTEVTGGKLNSPFIFIREICGFYLFSIQNSMSNTRYLP